MSKFHGRPILSSNIKLGRHVTRHILTLNSSDEQANQYICTNQKVFYTASVIWGAIGPRRMFSDGALYSDLRWFWLVGAVTPLIAWFFARKYPMSTWRYVHVPLILGGSGYLPPATTYIYLYVFSIPPAPYAR